MKHNDSFNEAFKRGMDAFVHGDFKKSVKEFTKAIEIDPDYALTYVSRGTAFMKMGTSRIPGTRSVLKIRFPS